MPTVIAKISLKRQGLVTSRTYKFESFAALKTKPSTFSVIRPTRWALHGFDPSLISIRQILPPGTGATYPKKAFQDFTVVCWRPTAFGAALRLRKLCFKYLPMLVIYEASVLGHWAPPKSLIHRYAIKVRHVTYC
jgi:hypothetical protein